MTTKQMKAAIAEKIAKVSDQAPEEMVKHVLEAVEELMRPDGGRMERMQRFLKNIEEDKNLLQRLAQ